MTVLWRPVDPEVTFNKIIRALARKDCVWCNGSGIEPGEEYPLNLNEVPLIHDRSSDRVCHCIPRFDGLDGPTVVIVRAQPPEATSFESVAYPDLNIEVLR